MAVRDRAWLVAGLGGVALGLAIGLSLGVTAFQGRGAERGATGGERIPSALQENVTVPAAVETTPRANAEDDGAPAPSAPRTDDPAVAVAARIPVAADAGAVPAGCIRGRVVDEAGRPVQGVAVRCWPVRMEDVARRILEPWRDDATHQGAPPPAVPSVDTVLRNAAHSYRAALASFRDATSDADGRFELPAMPAGRYSIRGFKEGLIVEPVAEPDRTYGPGSRVVLIAHRSVAVPVRVLGPDGRTAPSATVIFRTRDPVESFVDVLRWTAESPDLRLRPGAWTVTASTRSRELDPDAWSEYSLSSEPRDLDLLATGPVDVVELRLRAPIGIRGRVFFPDGEPTSECFVLCAKALAGEPAGPSVLRHPERSARVGNGEPYSFDDLAPGPWVVGFAAVGDPEITSWFAVDVREGLVEQDFHVPEIAPEDAWIVRVVGPDGGSVHDVTFSLERRLGEQVYPIETRIASREPGEFFVVPSLGRRAMSHEASSTETHVLTARSRRLGTASTQLSPAQGIVSLAFAAPATLMVRIQGGAGSASVKHARVHLLRPQPQGPPQWMLALQSIEESGEYRFEPLSPGEALVMLSTEATGIRRELSRTRIVVRPGKNEITLPLPVLHRLVVRAPRLAVTVGLALESSDDGAEGISDYEEVGADGSASFELLPAGLYTIRCWGTSATGRMRVRVPGSPVVDFVPDPVQVLDVEITDPSGLLAGAGFRSGDRIVAIDGKEFGSADELEALRAAAVLRPAVEVRVERGGSTVALTIEPRLLRPHANSGGTLRSGKR